MPELLLALDVGTTSARALVCDPAGRVLAVARERLVSRFPAPGEVEQDAREVWAAALSVIRRALADAGRTVDDLAAVGVTTQRASVVLWDRQSGEPVAPVLVWSDLRGVQRARELRDAGFTGWPQTPAAKLEFAIDMAADGRARAQRGELAWGTLDSFLVWKLSGGGAHVTDLSNAWLTGYLDFTTLAGWDTRLLAHQGLPDAMFPRLVDTWGVAAETAVAVLGAAVPISAIVADQQAGMIAHDALAAGRWKATLGTSAVLMASSGETPHSPHRTMPVEALAQAGGRRLFCFEGMVVTWGAFIDWMCQGLGLFADAQAMAAAAASVPDSAGAVVRPALQGLGAPHGRFDATAAFASLTPAVTAAHLARAAFEGLAFRLREIADCIAADAAGGQAEDLPVDGGGAGDEILQVIADLTGRRVRRHAVSEGTAFGAAAAAGLGAGLLTTGDLHALATYSRSFEPRLDAAQAEAAFERWLLLQRQA